MQEFATRHEPVSALYTGGPTAVALGTFGAARPALPALPVAGVLVMALVAGAALGRRRR